MPTWIDDNTIEGELPTDEFTKKVTDEMRERVEREAKEGKPLNYGNDGFIEIYKEDKQHAGISYQLRALSYFAVFRLPNDNFQLRPTANTINKIGRHVVVEHKGPGVPYALRDLLDLSEFLYHDSLHIGQEDWTLKQQWEEMDKWAKEDCERVPSLASEFDARVRSLQQELVDFVKAIKAQSE